MKTDYNEIVRVQKASSRNRNTFHRWNHKRSIFSLFRVWPKVFLRPDWGYWSL